MPIKPTAASRGMKMLWRMDKQATVFILMFGLGVLLLVYMPTALEIPASEDSALASFLPHIIGRLFAMDTLKSFLTNTNNSFLLGAVYAAPWILFSVLVLALYRANKLNRGVTAVLLGGSYFASLMGKAYYINALNSSPETRGPLNPGLGSLTDVPVYFLAAILLVWCITARR